jgi:CubicO group peptidase (beta-lactamase class C family)
MAQQSRGEAMRAAVVSAVIAAVCSAAAVAQPAAQSPDAQIDAVFSAFNKTTPGCAVGVAKDGKPLFSKGYGMADLEHGAPITPKTMFYMASVSKQFTALTVLMLAKEGKLALTDRVKKYVPELPASADKITVYQLLTHTSGVRDYFTLGGLAGLPAETSYTDDLVLRMLGRQQGLNFEPGTQFLYSNSGYVLLSIIVKRVTGQPLNAVARGKVFGPLGMTTTLFQHDHTHPIPEKAIGYVPQAGAWRISNSPLDVVGDGGLYSSIDDMFRWMANFDAPKVGADSLTVMEEPGKLSNGKTIEYGMGLAPGAYRGLKVIDHSGGLAGYRTEDMWFPSQRLGVVVLCNNGAANATVLGQRVADVFLKDAPQPAPAGPGQAAKLDDKPEVPVDPKLLDAYAGDYQLTPNLALSFVRDGDHLVAQASGQPAAPMYAVSSTAFRLKIAPIEVDFDNPADGGKAQGAVFHQNGAVIRMKRIDIVRPSAEQLKAYEGRFYSPELDVTYELSVRDGGLRVHFPGGDLNLSPLRKDVFSAQGGTATFTCGASGPCTGFSIDDGRAAGLRFTRVAGASAGAKPGG